MSVWHDILSRGSTRRVEVFCREGMAWLDNDFLGPLHVQTHRRAPRSGPARHRRGWRDLALGDDEIGLAISAYVEADRAFVDAVSAGRPPEPGLDVALEAHLLVDAAYRSAAGGGVPIRPRPTQGSNSSPAASSRSRSGESETRF